MATARLLLLLLVLLLLLLHLKNSEPQMNVDRRKNSRLCLSASSIL